MSLSHALLQQLLVRLPRLAGDALPLCPELLARVAEPDAQDRAPALAAVTQLVSDGVLNQHDDYLYPGCTFLNYVAWGKLTVPRPTAADHLAVDRALVAWSGVLLDAGYAWTVERHIALNQLIAAAERMVDPLSSTIGEPVFRAVLPGTELKHLTLERRAGAGRSGPGQGRCAPPPPKKDNPNPGVYSRYSSAGRR